MKTIKLPEEHIEEYLSNFGVRKTLDKTQNILIIREKMNKWASSKLKMSTAQKNTIKKMNRQATDWEKIFTMHTSDEGLESCDSIVKTQITLLKSRQMTPQAHYKDI